VDRGVLFIHPFGNLFVSFAHSDDDIDQTLRLPARS